MSTISFRAAQKTDLQTLSSLVNSAYRGESSKAGWTTEADLLGGQRTDAESLLDMISGNQVILLAERKNELVGCVYLKHEGAQLGYLGMLTVSPVLQAGGLGKQILEAAEQFVKEQWNCSAMKMTVISVRAELIAWYERRGYQRPGEREPFPYGDVRFGLPKRSDLEFIVLKKKLL